MAEAKAEEPGVVVRGFLGAYAAGNGEYNYIGEKDGFSAYARDSTTEATNWRVYHADGNWIIGNEEGYNAGSTGNFAIVSSNDAKPWEIRKIWSNSRVNILERGHGPIVADITVNGFSGAYAAGNGKYHYIGDHGGAPAYARQSLEHATNWRVFQWSNAYWLISNETALKANSSSHFAYAQSSDALPPDSGYNNGAVSVGRPSIHLRGFLDAYAPGNGDYVYIGTKNGKPSYKRDSDTEATNWRIYYCDGHWVVGNEEGYKANNLGAFSTVKSSAVSPQSVVGLWSNTRVNVLEIGDSPLVDNVKVDGFADAYAPGNGSYFYVGDHEGRPAYARDSLDAATNWRVYYDGGNWIVGNDDGLGKSDNLGFAHLKSDGQTPPESGYNNEAITVKEDDGTVPVEA